MAMIRKVILPPGNPVYIGDRTALEMDLSIITYDTASARKKTLSGVEDLLQYKNETGISWININGLKDIAAIKRLGEMYNLHPLTVEDILHTEQQPKIEIFDTYRYMSIKTIQQENKTPPPAKNRKGFFGKKKEQQPEPSGFLIDQISIILMNNTVISIQEIPGDSFERIRKMILDDQGVIRKMGTDYLAYTLIDAVVDEYFITANRLEDDIENFEDNAAKTSDEKFIEKIQDTKKYLVQIRRAILPLRENIITIIRHGGFFQTDELKPFLQDLCENLNNEIAMVESHREWLTNIMDVNISVLTYQMNKVMKVLAIISTIFIPLTFIAGIYGMNFDFMPELRFRLGYPAVIGGMAGIAIVMIIFFKIRRWF